MKILNLITILSLLSPLSALHADQQRVDHDALKTFLDCQIKSEKESDCVRPKSKRIPSQVSEKNIKMKELKVDKAAVEDFGHPNAIDQYIEPEWRTQMRLPRGSAMPR